MQLLRWQLFTAGLATAQLMFSVIAHANVETTVCDQENYLITNEAQFDAFTAETEQCGIVTGDVEFRGLSFTKLTHSLSLSEIQGSLIIENTNIRQFFWGIITDVEFKQLGGVRVENNDDLITLSLIGLKRPPGPILVNANESLAEIIMIPVTAPAASEITISDDWVFTNNFLKFGVGIDIGFPTLTIKHTRGIIIANNSKFASGPVLDFSGLTEVNGLEMYLNGFAGGSTLGSVTYGTDNFGRTIVSVTGGFQDLKTAGSIVIDQSGFDDISFPALETVDNVFIQEDHLADVNIPRVQQLDRLTIRGLGNPPGEGAEFGDRAGSLGRDWGLGRLGKVTERFELWMNSDVNASGLNALNIMTNNGSNGLELCDGFLDIRARGLNEFSINAITNICSVMKGLHLEGRYSAGLEILNNVVEIRENLSLINLDFEDLTFLSKVQVVGGTLQIQDYATDFEVGSLNGIENISSIDRLEVISMRMENCDALLPLTGWGDADVIPNDFVAQQNTPVQCNTPLTALQEQAAPGSFSVSSSQPAEGGILLSAFTPTASTLFPITSYEATCQSGDDIYQATVPASNVVTSDTYAYINVIIDGMPAGGVFQCGLAAVNEFGIRSEADEITAVTPPQISSSPTVLSIEETNGGILVYFDPTNYFGAQWFGSVTFLASCGAGATPNEFSASSALVTSSPAFIAGLDTESNLNCVVTIDNIYETVTSPVFSYEPQASSGLPIWLLYEASKP